MMDFKHARTTAYVWGSEPPAHTIACEKPQGEWDSGFSVLFSDAPDPESLPTPRAGDTELPEGISLMCLHCLIDEYPEIGRGLDMAREHGVVILDDNDEHWIPGDASAIERD
jgi:hypothetical protein